MWKSRVEGSANGGVGTIDRSGHLPHFKASKLGNKGRDEKRLGKKATTRGAEAGSVARMVYSEFASGAAYLLTCIWGAALLDISFSVCAQDTREKIIDDSGKKKN